MAVRKTIVAVLGTITLAATSHAQVLNKKALSLAVAKKIVDEHDGAIGVKSTEGEGTVFTIRLPVLHMEMADPSHTHGPAR